MTHPTDVDQPVPFSLTRPIGLPTMLDERSETFTTLEAHPSPHHTAAATVLYLAALTLLLTFPALVVLAWRAAL